MRAGHRARLTRAGAVKRGDYRANWGAAVLTCGELHVPRDAVEPGACRTMFHPHPGGSVHRPVVALSALSLIQALAWPARSSWPERLRRRGRGVATVLVREVTDHAVTGPADDRADWVDDATLIAIVVVGDEQGRDALAELYQRHGASCYRLACRVTASGPLAEDAVQEAFLALWRQPGAYRAVLGSVRNWLLSLTHHKAVDVVRREDSQRRRNAAQAAVYALDLPDSVDPAAAAWNGIRATKVRKALADLPESQRKVLALAYFAGYTQREIAELTGVPLGTVKTRMFLAMRRLACSLSAVAEGPGSG